MLHLGLPGTKTAIEGPKAVVELLIYIDDIGIFTKNDDE